MKHSHPHQRCAKGRAHKHTLELGAGSWRSMSYRYAYVLMECRVSALLSPGGDADVHAPSGGSNFNLCQKDEGALVEPEATPKEMMQPRAVQGGKGGVEGKSFSMRSSHRASLAPESRQLIREVIRTQTRAHTHKHTHTHTNTHFDSPSLARAHTEA